MRSTRLISNARPTQSVLVGLAGPLSNFFLAIVFLSGIAYIVPPHHQRIYKIPSLFSLVPYPAHLELCYLAVGLEDSLACKECGYKKEVD